MKKQIKNLGRFEVFEFNEINWIWPDKTNNGLFECEAVNGGAVLYIGPESNEINWDVKVVGKMVFETKE